MDTPNLGEEAIFNVARQIPTGDARREYLRQACGDDAALHGRVEALLAVHDQERSFLQSPAVDLLVMGHETAELVPGPQDVDRAGAVVGAYKLLQQIGEGEAQGLAMHVHKKQMDSLEKIPDVCATVGSAGRWPVFVSRRH